MKKVYLIACSAGTRDSLSQGTLQIIDSAGLVLGAERLITNIHPKRFGTKALTDSTAILAEIRETRAETIAVLFSGDTGFFSGARRLAALLADSEIAYEILPGVSSLAMAAAAFGLSYENVKAVSLHGRVQDAWSLKRAVISGLMSGQPCFFLTDSFANPAAISRCIAEAGCPDLIIHIGENLGSQEQELFTGTTAEAAEGEFSPLSVVFTEGAPVTRPLSAGLPDEAFLRGTDKKAGRQGEGSPDCRKELWKMPETAENAESQGCESSHGAHVPMTKRYVRAAALSALALQPGDVVYDIGGGTGSVSVEAALLNRSGYVFSIEDKEAAIDLMGQNRERFHAYNMEIVPGTAPAALAGLPPADAAFVGGSRGNIAEIIDALLLKNEGMRIVIAAVTAETNAAAVQALTERSIPYEAVSLSAAASQQMGAYHLMKAENPVTLYIAEKTH